MAKSNPKFSDDDIREVQQIATNERSEILRIGRAAAISLIEASSRKQSEMSDNL